MSALDMMVILNGVLAIVNTEENAVDIVIVLGGLKWTITVGQEAIIGSAFRSENDSHTFRPTLIHTLLFNHVF